MINTFWQTKLHNPSLTPVISEHLKTKSRVVQFTHKLHTMTDCFRRNVNQYATSESVFNDAHNSFTNYNIVIHLQQYNATSAIARGACF